MTEHPEPALLDRLRAGDTAAFEEIVDAVGGVMSVSRQRPQLSM